MPGHTFPGCDAVFGGDIPIGAGMSSSAAVECGFAFALNQLFGFGISKMDLAKLSQRSENNFVGMNCGIMDPFINVFGEDRTVLKIDCRSFGEQMYHSHNGLRDEYQVSSPDPDFLVDAASTVPGVLGARMMGAGFGGCTINLVEQQGVQAFVEEMTSWYHHRTGIANNVYVTHIESGTCLLQPGEY